MAVLARRGEGRPNTQTQKGYRTGPNSGEPLAQYCKEVPVTEICVFLRTLIDEGKQVYTIQNCRSTLSAIHINIEDGPTIGSNRVVTQLLEGTANVRTLTVLRSTPFQPIHKATLPLLTEKALFLTTEGSIIRSKLSSHPHH